MTSIELFIDMGIGVSLLITSEITGPEGFLPLIPQGDTLEAFLEAKKHLTEEGSILPKPRRALGQSLSAAAGEWVRATLPCPYLAGDLTVHALSTRGLAAVLKGELNTGEVSLRVSTAGMVPGAYHPVSTVGRTE
jgi:hypothetical protein